VVDVDVNGETAEECGVQSMPTFKFYKAGKDVHTVSGGDLEAIKTNIAKFK
jgi:thioredoxin-like negative regulator of GroEL